jgi:DNA repair protein RecN (Recombination protein N)
MLKQLEICNYAIIDRLAIEFGPGLNILTGETGAGKSIIIGSLGLLLGERLVSGTLRQGEKHGWIEGIFDFSRNNLIKLSEYFDGVSVKELQVRREFSESGSSKCFINGKSVSVQAVKKAFEAVIDLHGQHQHQSLLYPENYYNIIDRFGKLTDISQRLVESYVCLGNLHHELSELQKKESKLREMRDFLEYQLQEITQINPQPGEDEALEQEEKLLRNAETIRTLVQECSAVLYDTEDSALSQIAAAQRILEKLSNYSPEMKTLIQELESATITIEEMVKTVQHLGNTIEFDTNRLEEINQRLQILCQLQKKYRGNVQEILAKKSEIEQSLSSQEELSDSIQKVKEHINQEHSAYTDVCIQLSGRREEAAQVLRIKILERFQRLGMENSLFDILVVRREKHGSEPAVFDIEYDGRIFTGDSNGIDDIQFRIATGRAERFLPISQIASGGELSRIMLAVKSALMQADSIPTLIFDEIDTGISGRIATAVGKELSNLARVHQIICITHLPQIAGMADHHFSVEKIEQDGRIVTRVKKLSQEERKLALARLIAGETVTDSHLKSAEELLKHK